MSREQEEAVPDFQSLLPQPVRSPMLLLPAGAVSYEEASSRNINPCILCMYTAMLKNWPELEGGKSG